MAISHKDIEHLLGRKFIFLYGKECSVEGDDPQKYEFNYSQETPFTYKISWDGFISDAEFTLREIENEISKPKGVTDSVWGFIPTPKQLAMLEDIERNYMPTHSPITYAFEILNRKPYPHYFFWEIGDLNDLRAKYLKSKEFPQ